MADDARTPLLPYEWPGSYVLGDEEVAAVSDVLRARSPFRFYGHDLQHYADRLEAAYRRRLGRRHCLAVNSGTSALAIAMGMLDVGPGDEVLVPGYLWVSCLAAVVRAGAIPRLVDIDDTFTMDPDDLERTITPRTKAVLVVHMSGATGHLDRLVAVARARGVPLVEDVAQANGGTFRGQPLGSFGDVAIFSFQYNKAITAGEGGLVACDDTALYRRAFALHDLGYARGDDGRLDTDDPAAQGWGMGARMSEPTAAVLTVQETKLDALVDRMRTLHARLAGGLATLPSATLRATPDAAGGNGSFVIVTWPDAAWCRDVVSLTRRAGVRPGPDGLNNVTFDEWGLHLYHHNVSLVAKRGTNTRGYPWTDPANAFADAYAYGPGSLARADDLFARSSLLAVPPSLADDQADAVVEAFAEAARRLGSA
jgi:dTDP-4-amino-4,6-dideoxygalactose transaminase